MFGGNAGAGGIGAGSTGTVRSPEVSNSIITVDGQRVHFFVPTYQSRDVEAVYLRDEQGLHPVRLGSSAGRMTYDFITHH